MQIQWFGQSHFKIQSKNGGEETIIAMDPYSKESGLKPSKFQADILTISQDSSDYNNKDSIKGEYFLITTPGEYETSGVFIYGIHTEKQPLTIFKIHSEGMNIVHLGNLNQELTDDQLSQLGNVDILFLPVGGGDVLDAKAASKLASTIEPRIIIPIHYGISGLKESLGTVEAFIKESGLSSERMDKLKITKNDLPLEQTQVVILNP